jgi:RHS repeat-associated protein
VRRVRRGYTGHEHDPETSLVNMGARLYDNVTARFMAPDPTVQVPGWTQSWNRFSYAWNSPMNWVDPFGLENATTYEGIFPDPASPTGESYRYGVEPVTTDIPASEVPGLTGTGVSSIESPAPLTAPGASGVAPDARTPAEAPGASTNEEFGPPEPRDFTSDIAETLWTTPLNQMLPFPGPVPLPWLSAQQIAEGNRDTVCAVMGGCSGGTDQHKIAGQLFFFFTLGRGKGLQAGARGFVRDFVTKNTRNFSAQFPSERAARSLARTKLGHSPVQVEPGKLRSQDGRWQYRAKPQDLAGHGPADGPHIHLERLNPETGEVLQNWHLRW